MENFVDILMATYNGEKYIDDQINSIINQTYNNWILYIHDDGSTDKTIKIIKSYTEKYPNKILFLEDNMKNLGATQNFAWLLKHSKSDYIFLCDQDDVWLPNKIEHFMNKMLFLETKWGKNTPLLIHSDLIVTDENLKTIYSSFWQYVKLNPKLSNDLYSLLLHNIVTGCAMMINKKAKLKSIPIPEEVIDHDHWIAINVAKYGKIYYFKNPYVLYRQHGTNVVGLEGATFYNKLFFNRRIDNLLPFIILNLNLFLKMFFKFIQNLIYYNKLYKKLRFKIHFSQAIIKKIKTRMEMMSLFR